MDFSGLRGFIFDCDGVLLNSRLANITFYNYLRSWADLPPLEPAGEEYVHMSTYEQALDHIFLDLPPERRQAALTGALEGMDWHRNYYSLLQAEEGLIPFLDSLCARKFFLGICTNRLSPLDNLLARFQLEKYFSPVQTASNSLPKPSPDGLLQILEIWGTRPDEVVYIGDSAVDALAARSAGVPFWSFKNKALAAQAYVEDYGCLMR